ncbi:MAG: hypothetical protein GY930_16415, partial [bacterium]|nr:hypothetical protein [bacterium]
MSDSTELIPASITVQALEAFSDTRLKAARLVEDSTLLALPDPTDRKQVKKIATARKGLKATRCAIEALRKEYTAPFLQGQRDIKAVADELVEIIAPAEARLSSLENDAKEWQLEEKRRQDLAHQELIDNRVATIAHLGQQLAPSVAGALNEETWQVLLDSATKDYDQKKAKEEARAKKNAAKLAAAEEGERKQAMLASRVGIAAKYGCALTAEDALSFSNDEWTIYADKLQERAKQTPAQAERE